MEHLQQVGYIGLRNPDGTMSFGFPVYIKVKNVDENGMTDDQREIVNKVSEMMLQTYEFQISKYIAEQKAKKIKEEET